MSGSDKLSVGCPCCHAELTVDRATGAVIHHREPKRRPADGKGFDELLAGLDKEKQEAEDVFSREVEAFKDRDRLLEERFNEALERAREDPDDKPPPRPFDFD